jgi:hypothetical protein
MSGVTSYSLKAAGIAALYATAGWLLCLTTKEYAHEACLDSNGYTTEEWFRFHAYYGQIVRVVTALTAFAAARSYRPAWSIGGLATGTLAALGFTLAEWRSSYVLGRVNPIWFPIQWACLLGMVFGLLGTIAVRRRTAQPGAPPNGGPALPLDNSEVTEGPPSVS